MLNPYGENSPTIPRSLGVLYHSRVHDSLISVIHPFRECLVNLIELFILVDDEPAVFRNAVAIGAESSTGSFSVLDGGNLAVYSPESQQCAKILGLCRYFVNHLQISIVFL